MQEQIFMNNQKNAFYKSVTDMIKQEKYSKALEELETFLEKNKNDEIGLSIYGSALQKSGDQKKAIEIFKKTVEIYPASFAAHADLAFTFMNTGNKDQAIKYFEKAVDINAKFYTGLAYLGKLYFEVNNYEKALLAVEKAELYDPLDNHYKRMQSAMREDKVAEGEEIARNMLRKQPGHPRAGFMLAYIANKVEAHEECADILRYCLEYHPANSILRKALVKAYGEIGEYGLALQEATILVETDPTYLHHLDRSRAFGQVGDHENSLASAEAAAKCIVNDDEELGNIDLLRGHTLRILGRKKESEAAYKDCIKHTPGRGAGWWGLADFKTYKFSNDDKENMETLIKDEKLDDAQRCQAAFALAKAVDNESDTKLAFSLYKRANDMRPKVTYNSQKNNVFCAKYIETFNKDMLKTQASPIAQGPTPIFIVGMPRAGSTLIEQILSSHSQIEGTMELATLPKLERKIKIAGGRKFRKHFPDCLIDFNEEELAAFGQEYIDKTAVYRTDKSYFIDKLPPNFERIGLIHKILPHAIIIDARRHPLDCGYSTYKQHFAAGHEYSYSLENTGNYYNCYLRLMDHWDDVLPEKVICVQYENTVQILEVTVKQILDHIGVDFEETCLRFHENKRAVKTASSEQVRQPIYTKGMGQWKKVEKELAPLFQSLGEDTLKRFEEYLPK